MRHIAISCVILFGSFVDGQSSRPSSSNTSVPIRDAIAQTAADMVGVNEGHPHGVPSEWGFYSGPNISDGNHASTSCKGRACNAMVYWGTIYVDEAGSGSTNTRVNIRNCQVYWLNRSTKQWIQLGPYVAPEGIQDYPEKFDGPTTPTNVRTEPDKSMSVLPVLGKTSHFYGPYPRIPIDPDNFAGVVTACEMRLILDNPSGPDDRARARFIGNVGADFYPQIEGEGILNNPGIGGGKYKFIKPNWRSFAMTTLTEKQLRSNPPPIAFEQATP